MIESRLGHLLERVEIEGFAPRKPVPISILNYVPKNKRKPQTIVRVVRILNRVTQNSLLIH